MTITVDVSPLIDAVDRRSPRITEATAAALRGTAQAAFDFAQLRIATHTKTGAMARSLKLAKVPGGWSISNDLQQAPHALFVHWGTRAHVIKPKNKRVLRWAGPTGFSFAKSVRHPGYKGDPYLRDAARTVPADFVRRLKSELGKT